MTRVWLQYSELRLEDEVDMWFSPDDPVLKTYIEFLEVFPSDEFNLVAFETRPPLDEKELTYLLGLQARLETVPYISEVITLANVEDVIGSEDALTVGPLIGEWPLSQDEILLARERIQVNPFIKGVLIAEDGRSLGVVLKVDRGMEEGRPDSDKSRIVSDEVQRILREEERETGRTYYFSGATVLDAEVSRIIEKDTDRFMPYTLILIALVLLIVFRNLACLLLPVICVTVSVVWTLGLKGWLDSPLSPVSPALFALIGVIGFADSIHIIQQYRLDLARLEDRHLALLSAFEHAGWPCFLTSLTTAIGFGSLIVSPLPIIRHMGVFASFGILSAFLLSMTIVPIGLRLTKVGPRDPGKRVERRMVATLRWIGRIDARFPRTILVISASIALLTGLGIPKIRVNSSLLQYFREDSWARQSAAFMDEKLGGLFNLEIILEGPEDSFKEPSTLLRIEKLEGLALQEPHVSSSRSVLDYLRFINRALHSDEPQFARIPATREEVSQMLFLYELAGGEEVRRYLTDDGTRMRLSLRTREMEETERRRLIQSIETYLEENLAEFRVELTGFTMLFDSSSANLVKTLLESMALALFIISCLMLVSFGLKVGSISLLPNLFPIIFIFGVMGYFGFPLNIGTSIIAAIAIGIVVDDTIHYVSHFRSARRDTEDSTKAAQEAINEVGGALTFTSLALTLGFGVSLISEGKILVDFGILSGLAIVTALVGDLFLTPVLLVRLGSFMSASKTHPH
ncbi:hypothetical protein EP232_04655 [bacterium]|nr:MAG: hypothetical protein EP232_04655 [bacterium]